MLYLTNSIMQCWKDCHRKFYWSEVKRYQPKASGSLFDGSVAHKAIKEFCLTGESDFEALKKAYNDQINAVGTSPMDIPKLNERCSKMLAMMRAYNEIYKDDLEKYEFVSIEEEIQKEIAPGMILAGTPDAVAIEKSTKYLTLFENKTTSRITGSYLERLNLDTQLTTYCYLLEHKFGKLPTNIVYNILAKTLCRLKKNETWEEFEQRVTELYLSEDENTRLYRENLIRDDAMMLNFISGVLQLAKEIEQMRDAPFSSFYINSAPCTYYEGCAYLPLCTQGEDIAKGLYVESERRGCYV